MEASQTIGIYLVDDETLVRAGMRALLEASGVFRVVGESREARDAIAEVGRLRPDIAIVDIRMPGLSGLDALPLLRRVSPRTRLLVATQHDSRAFVMAALRAGAHGYICKASDPRELVPAIESIYRGDTFVTSRLAAAMCAPTGAGPGQAGGGNGDAGAGANDRDGGRVAPPGGLGSLTHREREVFQLIAIGRSNKEIAGVLDISLGTAKKHRENLQRKIDLHSAAAIARLAIREGLLTP